MNSEIADQSAAKNKGERGSALLTVLFISTLLLAAGGALILVTGTSSKTAIDATAEMQAYYAAEAGLTASMNVLRGNVAPNGAMPAGTSINFRNAVTLASSNLPTDTTGIPRLSGWLNYNFTPTGAANPDRVTLTAGYTTTTGLAYSVQVIDPDDVPVATGHPSRLVLRATGYGPKGAIKRLEISVRHSNVNYDPPAMLMMRGADNGDPLIFDLGDSNSKDYSGHDHAPTGSSLPALGATSSGDTTIEINADTKDTVAVTKAATIPNSGLPDFLQTANQARAFLADQKANAIIQGRYFTTFDGYSGSSGSPVITFVDGDCALDGGAGLLIVTGNLEMKGNPNFEGLILVLGGGSIVRDGGGNGNIYGAIVVASFDVNGTGNFLVPTFHTNGGGTATLQYDSDAVRRALNTAGPRVLGIHEY